MRLTCPNCGAQYEVPDEVIPQSGRDVQCSNCGVTWFQHHPDHPPPEEDDSEPGWDAPAEADGSAGDEGGIEDAQIVGDPMPEEGAEDTEPAPGTVEAPAPERRALDSSVTDVLREEAERERIARAAERASALETQTEMGLSEGSARAAQEPSSETDRRRAEARARMKRLRDTSDEDDTVAEQPDPGTRRNLLPNIDEINSSLDSDSRTPGTDDAEHMDSAATADSGGFRRGFLSVVLLAVIGLLLYIFAPQLAEAVPALDGVMSGYVGLIDAARIWLDGMVAGLLG